MDEYKSTIERLCANNQAEQEQELQATIDRLTAGMDTYTATIDRLTGGGRPTPGHGPGKYTPQARATGRDMVSLFVPDTAFDGSWKDFRRARDEAIAWLRANRYAVVDSQKLFWGPSFELDPDPLSYRQGQTVWYNCCIDQELDYYHAKAMLH